MDRRVYARMAAVEDRHWWFVARRRIIAAVLRRLAVLPESARILEAGCGTGGNLAMLAGFGQVEAFEPDDTARAYARGRGPHEIRAGALPDGIPFDGARYDLVAALDILEHVDEDSESMRALLARLRPGGWTVITVPALPWLWSRHDELHHHKRRYRKAELLQKLRAAGFAEVRVSYFNTLLFPLVAAIRVLKKALGADDDDAGLPRSRLINGTLSFLFACERLLIFRLPLPVGVSLLALAQRPAS